MSENMNYQLFTEMLMYTTEVEQEGYPLKNDGRFSEANCEISGLETVARWKTPTFA